MRFDSSKPQSDAPRAVPLMPTSAVCDGSRQAASLAHKLQLDRSDWHTLELEVTRLPVQAPVVPLAGRLGAPV